MTLQTEGNGTDKDQTQDGGVMRKWRVTIRRVQFIDITVEAATEEEALDTAQFAPPPPDDGFDTNDYMATYAEIVDE